ncbi:MAG: 1-acyl-sn-glycerol-3-phosphate acyltransferase [Bacteroidales bacterium]|nr:1-acyl-sn-glycerol-3-phosphate acyltransferase [Bacteroidales bacterium]
MIKLNKVKKEGFGYRFFKFLSDRFHDNIFYRKVKYTGIENIVPGKPTLFGPNHQNALMDAMGILASRRKADPVFLARSDIFSSDLLGNLFVSMKILPVYRIRDGKDKLEKNEEIFNLSVEILEMNKDLVIFPEAQHTEFRSILQLKKGLMRVAFHTAEKNNFEIDLQIIPAGIYYKNYTNYRSQLLVNYGKPISINKYKEQYLENKQAALLAFRNDLREAIIPLAIHIQHKEFYDVYENSRQLFDYEVASIKNLKLNNMVDKFNIDKKIIKTLDEAKVKQPEKFEIITKKIADYFEKLKQNKLKDYLFDKKVSFIGNFLMSLLWIVLLPLSIFSWINFAIPILTPELLVKKFKDTQFHSSVRYVVALFLPFVWSLVGVALLWIFVNIWWVTLIYFVVQYPLLVTWLELRKQFKKITGKWRYIFKAKKVTQLKIERKGIIDLFNDLYE